MQDKKDSCYWCGEDRDLVALYEDNEVLVLCRRCHQEYSGKPDYRKKDK